MTDNTQQGSTGPLLDRSDVRVKHAGGSAAPSAPSSTGSARAISARCR